MQQLISTSHSNKPQTTKKSEQSEISFTYSAIQYRKKKLPASFTALNLFSQEILADVLCSSARKPPYLAVSPSLALEGLQSSTANPILSGSTNSKEKMHFYPTLHKKVQNNQLTGSKRKLNQNDQLWLSNTEDPFLHWGLCLISR